MVRASQPLGHNIPHSHQNAAHGKANKSRKPLMEMPSPKHFRHKKCAYRRCSKRI